MVYANESWLETLVHQLSFFHFLFFKSKPLTHRSASEEPQKINSIEDSVLNKRIKIKRVDWIELALRIINVAPFTLKWMHRNKGDVICRSKAIQSAICVLCAPNTLKLNRKEEETENLRRSWIVGASATALSSRVDREIHHDEDRKLSNYVRHGLSGPFTTACVRIMLKCQIYSLFRNVFLLGKSLCALLCWRVQSAEHSIKLNIHAEVSTRCRRQFYMWAAIIDSYFTCVELYTVYFTGAPKIKAASESTVDTRKQNPTSTFNM